MTAERELLPCPFCGKAPHKANVEGGQRAIYCLGPCAARPCVAAANDNDASEQWNRRAAPVERDAVIEQCAGVCEEMSLRYFGKHGQGAATNCAIAIRALKSTERKEGAARREGYVEVLDGQRMTNDELKVAIDYTWMKLNQTGSIYAHHAPMLEHYKALLKEQERRATLATAPEEK